MFIKKTENLKTSSILHKKEYQNFAQYHTENNLKPLHSVYAFSFIVVGKGKIYALEFY